MSKKRYFIGKKVNGTIEPFSTTDCKDPETQVILPALAKKHGYIECNGEYASIGHAQIAAAKGKF